MPKVSVIMGVYNVETTIEAAINSILEQTYQDFELILCDDGSTDKTFDVASQYEKKYTDKIVLLKNEKNMGLNYTLNKCLVEAKGVYIARMDGDDVCDSERFAEEIAVLENEPDIAIVSTDMQHFDESGTWGRISHPTYPQNIDFLRGTPFCHAPCMVRKEAYDAVGGYSVDDKLLRVEDYHLWMKMYMAGYRGKNLNKALYSMRDDRNAYSRRKFKYRINETYVHLCAVKKLKLPKWGYLCACKPILVGLLPEFLYNFLHRVRLNRREGNDS